MGDRRGGLSDRGLRLGVCFHRADPEEKGRKTAVREIQKELAALTDETYAAFQRKLLPTTDPETVMGVRMPAVRRLAAELAGTEEAKTFLAELPHRFYDENMLHAALLQRERDLTRCLEGVERFLPYVDNWAVCDTLRPGVFGRHRGEILPYVKRWAVSGQEYVCRFGIGMLMCHYLDEAFDPVYPALAAATESEAYYVRMMVAWYFATALAKQWDAVVPFLEERRLPAWTHDMTIRKACESFRLSDEQKAYLRTLR